MGYCNAKNASLVAVAIFTLPCQEVIKLGEVRKEDRGVQAHLSGRRLPMSAVVPRLVLHLN